MPSTNSIRVPDNYLNDIHPDTAKVICQKDKGVLFSGDMFTRLQVLVAMAVHHLGTNEADSDEETPDIVRSAYRIDKAVDFSDMKGDFKGIPFSRLLLLTNNEIADLLNVLKLAGKELDSRMGEIDDLADEAEGTEMLHFVGLDEVVAVVKHNARDVVFGPGVAR